MSIVLPALLIWGALGVAIAGLLSRHGHNFWLYAFIGLGYGPLLLLVWWQAAHGLPTSERIIHVDGHQNTDGWIDVLVGLDGTDDAVESTRHVIATLAGATRRVRLASVIDHEVSGSAEAFETDDRRISYLEAAARSLGMPNAEISLLSGQPDKALTDHATEHNFDLLVVAHRRDTLLSGIRGSTVGRLARNADLPVLIGPPVG